MNRGSKTENTLKPDQALEWRLYISMVAEHGDDNINRGSKTDNSLKPDQALEWRLYISMVAEHGGNNMQRKQDGEHTEARPCTKPLNEDSTYLWLPDMEIII